MGVAFLTPTISAILAGYIVSIPIARMAAYECTPTLFASLISIVSVLLSTSLFIDSWMTTIPTDSFIFSITIVVLLFVMCIITHIIEIRGPSPDFVDMRGKTVLITGANSGIGLETARQLCLMGATVILGCRSPSRGKGALEDIKLTLAHHKAAVDNMDHSHVKENPEALAEASGKVILLDTPLDLSSLESVSAYARAYQNEIGVLDVIVCNAGLIPFAVSTSTIKLSDTETRDIEGSFVANHLGHHLLLQLLLPLLKSSHTKRQESSPISPKAWASSDPSRIVIVSSSLHKCASGPDAYDMDGYFSKFSPFPTYSRGKLANLMGAHELYKVIQASPDYKDSISINSLHPGNPVTSVTANLTPILRVLEKIFYPFMFLWRETCTAGAFCSVWTASSPQANDLQDQYYIHNAPAVKNKDSINDEYTSKLWDLCLELTKYYVEKYIFDLKNEVKSTIKCDDSFISEVLTTDDSNETTPLVSNRKKSTH